MFIHGGVVRDDATPSVNEVIAPVVGAGFVQIENGLTVQSGFGGVARQGRVLPLPAVKAPSPVPAPQKPGRPPAIRRPSLNVVRTNPVDGQRIT